MHTTAHPDDEDGGMLTLEVRGHGVTGLQMTLTRGEGGQNKTGNAFGDELGILRTLEMLAADKYYGVEQRFSRVADFGFSKTADETFQKWGGHDTALADLVRVIRTFRPDVIITRFQGASRDGHGNHQASGLLTREAFRAAADPTGFPIRFAKVSSPGKPRSFTWTTFAPAKTGTLISTPGVTTLSSGRLIYSSPCKGYVISCPRERVCGRSVRDRTTAITS